MQTVLRQDGSQATLSDAEAEQWIKRGIATALPVAAPMAKPKQDKFAHESTFNEGETK